MISNKTIKGTMNGIISLQLKWYHWLWRRQQKDLAALIQRYHAHSRDPEILEVLAFLRRHPVRMLPYEYCDEYKTTDVEVFHETGTDWPYVVVGKRRVYFPREFSEERIRHAVMTARIEQDPRSPHRYLAGADIGGVGVLVGASDGLFAMSIIDKFRKLYLFETDPLWIPALAKTFPPWNSAGGAGGDCQVHIVQLYVCDRDEGRSVTLDNYLEGKEAEIYYLQADVEGDEVRLLAGATRLLERSPRVNVSICCYHRHQHERLLGGALRDLGFEVRPSPGYMICGDHYLKKPYLRRGIIYGRKIMK